MEWAPSVFLTWDVYPKHYLDTNGTAISAVACLQRHEIYEKLDNACRGKCTLISDPILLGSTFKILIGFIG